VASALPESLLKRIDDPVQRERLRKVRDDLASQRPVTADEAPQSLLDRFEHRLVGGSEALGHAAGRAVR